MAEARRFYLVRVRGGDFYVADNDDDAIALAEWATPGSSRQFPTPLEFRNMCGETVCDLIPGADTLDAGEWIEFDATGFWQYQLSED